MCDPVSLAAGGMVLSTGVSVYAGLEAAKGQKEIAKSNKAYYYYLASLSDKEAGMALTQGARDQNTISVAERGVESSQRAIMAANGVGAGSVTAEDLIKNTFNQAELDKMAVRYNANVTAWNKKNEASSYRMAGNNAVTAGNINADTTLLTTASSVADKWINYGTSGGFKLKSKSKSPSTPIKFAGVN